MVERDGEEPWTAESAIRAIGVEEWMEVGAVVGGVCC